MKLKTKIVITVIITFFITASISVTAILMTNSNNIIYSNSETNKTNVKDSLDELYTISNFANNPWEGMEGVIYYLGTSTNYDIPSLITSGKLPSFLDYTKLTSDNFVVGIDSIPTTTVAYKGLYHNWVSGKTVNTPVTKNYDSTTGTLSISGGTYIFHICIDDGPDYCSDGRSTATSLIKTYLVIKSIK